MKAGRELDALIAIHVMEWKWEYDAFEPSTDIADAWLVVEKLREQNLFMDVETFEKFYRIRVYRDDYEFDGFKSMANLTSESAPMAICLAALKAVGVEVE